MVLVQMGTLIPSYVLITALLWQGPIPIKCSNLKSIFFGEAYINSLLKAFSEACYKHTCYNPSLYF